MKNNSAPSFIYFLPAVAWFVTIFILLVLPNKDFEGNPLFIIPYFDKVVHIGIFGLLTVLAMLPWGKRKKYNNKTYLIIAISIILYGIAMEFVQKYFTHDRGFDYFDMLADATGAILAYIFMRIILRIYQKKQDLKY